MDYRNTQDRYGPLGIALHWMTMVLVTLAYACVAAWDLTPAASAGREAMKSLHYLLGLWALLAVCIRVLARHVGGAVPPIQPSAPEWHGLLAPRMHWALYAYTFCTPLMGWLALSVKGVPIDLFGLKIPALIDPAAGSFRQLRHIHIILASIGCLLITLHALSALFRHYIVRDNTLRRILPGRGAGQG